MLSLYVNNEQHIIANDDYYIRQIASGLDEVIFNISIWDPLYPQIVEEASIRDRDQQWYLIKQIDGGTETAKIVAQLDLDAWKAEMLVGYTNNSATLYSTINGVLPQGWTFLDKSGLTIQRTIEGDFTPLGVVDECRDTYGVYFRFDNVKQTITAMIPDEAQPLGAFATRDLNLKEINYKGKSTDLVTRLYAYGADGLSFASINNGLPYVDNNTYSDRVICAVWKDDRYTIAENLLEDAKKNLAAMAVPSRSYDCDVVDLRATNPEMYGFQNFEIFSVATLIDDAKDFAINYQVVERWDYPYYPDKNKVIFSSSPSKIQNQVTHITQQIENPNSSFRQQQQAAIDNATNWITGVNGGYVVLNRNSSGQAFELLIMDTPDIATATKVWRWNQGGLGYSSNGYNGPYATAITQDGSIVADFITTGTLNAQNINVVNLNASGISSGIITTVNPDRTGKMTIDLDNTNLFVESLSGKYLTWLRQGALELQQGITTPGNYQTCGLVGVTTAGTGFVCVRDYEIGTSRKGEQVLVLYLDREDNTTTRLEIDKAYIGEGLYIPGQLQIGNKTASWQTITLEDGSEYTVLVGSTTSGNIWD